jgi:DNA-binding response OmpR family regulator
MAKKILVVEDEPALRETLAYNLKNQGYKVRTAADGEQALALARKKKHHLIILDVMLPMMDGFEVCRILRQENNVPILILTARDDEIDRVVGLEIGADDYMTKPFSMRELVARVKALLRRVKLDQEDTANGQSSEAEISLDGLTIDFRRREVRLDEQKLDLKPKEFELLAFLARHRGQVFSRDKILEHVWGWSYGGGSRTVDVHVRWLRQKLEQDPKAPSRIVTVRGTGYRFEG